MDLELKGKFALVTGGSHGIGLATAQALANEGCNVAICARSEGPLQEAASDLEARGVSALGIQCDAMVAADIERAVNAVTDKWGTIHILVNNVGGGGRWGSPVIEDTPEDVWADVYSKNAMAAVRFTRLVIPFMRKQKWGRVVTVASIFGREGGGRPWFNMAKSAEISLMKSLAMTNDLVRDNITFNTVAPGHIYVPGTGIEDERTDDEAAFARRLDTEFPMGRMGTPEEVASVIVFACSTRASLLSGTSIPVDGGESRSF